MRRSSALAAVLISLAAPALALSCRPYSPVIAFEQAVAAPEDYLVVHGRLAFEPLAGADPQRLREVAAQVTGAALTAKGFSAPLSAPVRLRLSCVGPWCAEIEPGQDYLLFLERAPEGYRLDATPCQPRAFAKPDRATLDRMRACLAGACR